MFEDSESSQSDDNLSDTSDSDSRRKRFHAERRYDGHDDVQAATIPRLMDQQLPQLQQQVGNLQIAAPTFPYAPSNVSMIQPADGGSSSIYAEINQMLREVHLERLRRGWR